MINIAVLGYGTVGSGVVEVIEKNKEMVNKKAAQELDIKYILDLRDFPNDPYGHKVIHDFNQILKDDTVTIVCETMGGTGAAYEFTKQALERGKSVCTSNKELVAKHGPELLSIAKAHSCNYLFEASVGGGIPIIRPLNYSLTAEKIEAITGILNGTTNYILSKMEREGADFEEVLKRAQEKGYAERNPEADVEGYDACRKIAILSSLMLGKNVDSEKIYTEGISKISAADFAYAKAAGKTIKLLARSKTVSEDEVLAMVAPFMIDKEHPLSMVNGVFNAVFVTGNMLGDSMYYGKGAGKLPTASAVVSDVIDCARHPGRVIMCFWEQENIRLADVSLEERSFFIRARAGFQKEIEEAFPGGRLLCLEGREQDFGYFTPVMQENDFTGKYEALADRVLGRIRLL
ncbi:MAG TPA: homoserine dehydrogenase [Candidatus Acetatifactor stercoripullorum]|uniref:Homoserine dehydrogenase n=1 Tax=Candidatus Acetatifactor stercoripullorum TaxID=2838414 RepID=A0A9D1R361_9FIRM|nr:homoserine dehydrogenase [uncultured Acetatifactor sp.]HIW80015.1 homoserine dehydrogenase [Candidatus Acetatifactor stercoripullorum]